jgi:hypothetical protein
MTGRFAAVLVAFAFVAHPHAKDEPSSKQLSKDARREFFRAAQVWTPVTVGELDLRTGPPGKRAFAPDSLVECDFVESKRVGSSKKFNCKLADGDVVKVRYGADNGEVQGSVLTSRLFWALGFGADAAYPVRLLCRGCSDDPWNKRKKTDHEQMFDLVTIERKAPGHEMHGDPDGWAWPELDLVDDTQGGAPRHQRDALKLLAVLVQHTDTKAEQQRLNCLPGGLADNGACSKPFLIVHDVGLTFGHANLLNRNDTASVNFELWADTPIWRDKAACVAHLAKSSTGTLGDPKISEAGRAFLAGLLDQLSEQQIRDLFTIGHVERRSRKPGTSEPPASVDDWVRAFVRKRAEIDATHCPD